MPCPSDCQPRNFGLNHDLPTDFVRPQTGDSSLWYVIYRVVAATYFCLMLVHNILAFEGHLLWFVYMAHWCFVLITVGAVLQAVCVTRHYTKMKSQGYDFEADHMQPLYKVIWVLQNILYSSAPIVTIFYWNLYYEGTGINLVNTNTHIVNIIYCVIEIGITAIPVRFLHFYMSQLYATVYIIFTLIYWGAGGTGVDGEPYLYKTFDYGNRPLAAFLWYCAFVIFGFLLHFFAYTVAFVRGLIIRRYQLHMNKIDPVLFTTREAV